MRLFEDIIDTQDVLRKSPEHSSSEIVSADSPSPDYSLNPDDISSLDNGFKRKIAVCVYLKSAISEDDSLKILEFLRTSLNNIFEFSRTVEDFSTPIYSASFMQGHDAKLQILKEYPLFNMQYALYEVYFIKYNEKSSLKNACQFLRQLMSFIKFTETKFSPIVDDIRVDFDYVYQDGWWSHGDLKTADFYPEYWTRGSSVPVSKVKELFPPIMKILRVIHPEISNKDEYKVIDALFP